MKDLLSDIVNNAKKPEGVVFGPQDVMAAIGFEAQRIANAIAQHSAGAPVPDPKALQGIINRMSELNDLLIQALEKTRATAAANQGGVVLLTN